MSALLAGLLLSGCAEQPLLTDIAPPSAPADSLSFLRNAAVAYYNEGAKIYAAYASMWETIENSGQKPLDAEYRSRADACAYFTRAQELNALLPDTAQIWYIRDAARECLAPPPSGRGAGGGGGDFALRGQMIDTDTRGYLPQAAYERAIITAKGLAPGYLLSKGQFRVDVPGGWSSPVTISVTVPGYQPTMLVVPPANFDKALVVPLRPQPKCYETLRAEGIALMNGKKYEAAGAKFTAAAQCPDVPIAGNDLPGLLEQAGKLALAEQQRMESERIAGQRLPATDVKKLLRAGNLVYLKTEERISSKNAEVGEIVSLLVATNVLVNGRVVIAAGAYAEGRIRSVNKGNVLGSASIVLEVLDVQAIDGQRISLRTIPFEKRSESNASEAVIESGTILSARVLQDLDGSFDEESEPDDDQDGTPNATDLCPKVKGEKNNRGCPTGDLYRQHTVQDGESLRAIATRYNMDLQELAVANGMDANDRPLAGKIVLIPVPKPKPLDLQAALAEIERNMVSVPAGSFQMGCDEKRDGRCYDDDAPLHEVKLSAFRISKYEITQEQWEAVMGNNPSRFKGCNKCPIESISWLDAEAFVKKISTLTGKKYRLPTEAEWEYSARGGKLSNSTIYAGSNDVNEVAWYGNNSGKQTHQVGSKLPNELGLFDMGGNVWEWCQDWYGANYYSQKDASYENPLGPSKGKSRILRGGSWLDDNSSSVRIAESNRGFPDYRGVANGFRCAMSISDQKIFIVTGTIYEEEEGPPEENQPVETVRRVGKGVKVTYLGKDKTISTTTDGQGYFLLVLNPIDIDSQELTVSLSLSKRGGVSRGYRGSIKDIKLPPNGGEVNVEGVAYFWFRD